MQNYQTDEVVKTLQRKGVYINTSKMTIQIPNDLLLGNKSLGKIDYLLNYCRYHIVTGDEYRNFIPSQATGGSKPETKAGKKIRKARANLARRTANFNYQTTNRSSGQQFYAPGSLSK